MSCKRLICNIRPGRAIHPDYRAFCAVGQDGVPLDDFTSARSRFRLFLNLKCHRFFGKGDTAMEDTPRDIASETECAVTVYDGSWMTCDMIEEDADE